MSPSPPKVIVDPNIESWWELSAWEIAADRHGDHLLLRRYTYELRAYLPHCESGHHSAWWSLKGPGVELHGIPQRNALSQARSEVVERYKSVRRLQSLPE